MTNPSKADYDISIDQLFAHLLESMKSREFVDACAGIVTASRAQRAIGISIENVLMDTARVTIEQALETDDPSLRADCLMIFVITSIVMIRGYLDEQAKKNAPATSVN